MASTIISHGWWLNDVPSSTSRAAIGEVFPEPKKIGPQLQYAEKRGFRLALIAGSAEFEQGVWKVKDLGKREEKTLPEADLVKTVGEMLK